MDKYPFTATGVAQLQVSLHQLSDKDLQGEAFDLSLDFIGWLNHYFRLSTSQMDFLDAIDPSVRHFIAEQCSFALAHRLPILLDKPETAGPMASKIVRPENKLQVTASADGKVEVSGELLIHIRY